MTTFVKPLMLSVFAVGALALTGVAQRPADVPPAPSAPPVPPTPVIGGFGPGGFGGGDVTVTRGGPLARSFFEVRPFGDDPRTRELAKKLADAKDDDDKEKLRADLKAALAKAFDDRLKGQEKQVADLEAQLKKLKEMVGKRKEAKADIVADRLTSLEKEAKGLGW